MVTDSGPNVRMPEAVLQAAETHAAGIQILVLALRSGSSPALLQDLSSPGGVYRADGREDLEEVGELILTRLIQTRSTVCTETGQTVTQQ